MSSLSHHALELEAAQALAALNGRPEYELPARHFTLPLASSQQDPQPPNVPLGESKSPRPSAVRELLSLIDEEVERHQDEDGRPVFKLLDTHELHCYNHIWHPLEASLHVEPRIGPIGQAAVAGYRRLNSKPNIIIFYAEMRDWARMIKHIRSFHDLLLPITSYEWRMPLDVRQTEGAPSTVPSTLENTVWMIVALCQQLFRACAEGAVEPESANEAIVRLEYLVVHLLRRPTRFSQPKMMLPAQFFNGTILQRSLGHPQDDSDVSLPPRPGYAQTELSPPQSHDISMSSLTDDNSAESPPEKPLTPSSPRLFSSFRPANHDLDERESSEPVLGRKRSRSESSISSSQVVGEDTLGDTMNEHTTTLMNGIATQSSPRKRKRNPKRQKGEGVLEKTKKELDRAEKLLDPEFGMLAPEPCVRCRDANIKCRHKCYIPRPEFQAKHGMTCYYCRTQKTKCSFNPKYADKPASFFLKRAANGETTAGATTAVENGDEDGRQLGQSSQSSAHMDTAGEPSSNSSAQPTPEEDSIVEATG